MTYINEKKLKIIVAVLLILGYVGLVVLFNLDMLSPFFGGFVFSTSFVGIIVIFLGIIFWLVKDLIS